MGPIGVGSFWSLFCEITGQWDHWGRFFLVPRMRKKGEKLCTKILE